MASTSLIWKLDSLPASWEHCDWQSFSIEPAFQYADEAPGFAVPAHDPPEDDNTFPEDQLARDNAELCYQAFDASVRFLVPKLSAARALDDDILQLLLYCNRTYRDGAIVLRQALIEISKLWKELELIGSCPYPLPTSEALLVPKRELDIFETALKLKHNLMNLLTLRRMVGFRHTSGKRQMSFIKWRSKYICKRLKMPKEAVIIP